jgi:hypothetical protein
MILDPLIRRYLDMGWPLLPLGWNPRHRNFRHPLIENGVLRASREARIVEAWLKRWPAMMIGIRTGEAPMGSDLCVLDVDYRKPGKTGHLTMRELGFADPPRTPMVVTISLGRHLYFLCPRGGFGNTQGADGRGIGKDLDWRGNNGYAVAPGGLQVFYRWHSKCNLDTCPILPVPLGLMPREPVPEPELGDDQRRVQRVAHPDAYVEAILDRACREILAAGDGEQNSTLNGNAYGTGRSAARRNLAEGPLIAALIEAGCRMHNYRPAEPWTRAIVEQRVRAGFAAGQRKEGK